jgi:hypothetical protein
MIGHGIAEVGHREAKHGESQTASTQKTANVAQASSDPRQIPIPVAVRVGEAPRIDMAGDS